MKVFVSVAVLFASVSSAGGAPLSDGAPMTCTIKAVVACSGPDSCVRGTADTVAMPAVLLVDVAGRRVGGDRAGRTVRITSVGHGGGRMMLHGEEVEIGGRAWNVVIKEASGEMTGAVLSEPGGYFLFGSCVAREAATPGTDAPAAGGREK